MRLLGSLKRRLFAGSLLVVAVALSACESHAPQDFLNHQAGEAAQKAGDVWNIAFTIAVIIFVIVEGLLVYAIVRFRHRPGNEEAKQFHGNTKLEVLLTVIPALILGAIAIPTIKTIFDLAEKPTGDSLNVTVVAHQFWWEYRYTDQGVVTANELHIPTGKPVYLTLQGTDVIHSFWVPRLAGTQDVVPGHDNHLRLFTDQPGEYLGQCKEFCGLSHANMRLRVFAESPADFDEWIAAQQLPAEGTSGQAAVGEKAFLDGACAGCHTIGGTAAVGTVGPNLTHFASREYFAGEIFENNTQNLAKWLANPPAVKPGVDMPDLGLSQTDIESLIAFLQTLK